MRYFTDSAILLLYSMLAFFYVPADQSLVFSLLFTVILGCVTYLCRTSETESWPYNSLPVLKTSGNILPVLAGSYVVFGFCSLWITDLLLFFPLLLYQTLSARLFFWQWWNFHSGDSLLFSSTSFRKFSVSPESLVLSWRFFSGLIPGNMNSLPGISVRAVMTAKNTHFFFPKKTRRFWKNRIMRSMLQLSGSETGSHGKSMTM